MLQAEGLGPADLPAGPEEEAEAWQSLGDLAALAAAADIDGSLLPRLLAAAGKLQLGRCTHRLLFPCLLVFATLHRSDLGAGVRRKFAPNGVPAAHGPMLPPSLCGAV
jgi:hypothetical protein